jgi:GAF domain-containing protein
MHAIDSSGPVSSALIRTRLVLEARNCVFERIACGAPLSEVLTMLTRTCEEVSPHVLCSVLLLDAERRRLHHGAAPSLPESYCKAIDGVEIGPAQGSCGTAAYLGQRVIVEDVTTHPYWANYWKLAVDAGLRACWSEPIRGSNGSVLGTFAMYYAEPRRPDSADIDFIRSSAHVAGVAIERAQAEEELARYRDHLEELVKQRTLELERVNLELRQALADMRALSAMLPVCESCRRVRDEEGRWSRIESFVGKRSDAVFTRGLCPDCASGNA